VIAGADSTLVSCPCIKKFKWNTAKDKCEIDCSQVGNTEKWSIASIDSCECNQLFFFVKNDSRYNENFSCQINCSMIWNGDKAVNQTHCSCVNDYRFDYKTKTCVSTLSSDLFATPLSIALFAVGIIVGIQYYI
jgi:hypothetical protein